MQYAVSNALSEGDIFRCSAQTDVVGTGQFRPVSCLPVGRSVNVALVGLSCQQAEGQITEDSAGLKSAIGQSRSVLFAHRQGSASDHVNGRGAFVSLLFNFYVTAYSDICTYMPQNL